MKIVLLVALAIAPCLAIIFYIYHRDKFEKEPKGLLILTFFLGVLSIVPAIFLEEFLWKQPGIADHAYLRATVGTGLVEEGSKLLFILILPFWRKAFNEPLDGIIYSMMVSMGFATVENIMYVVQGGFGIGVLRVFTAVPAHAIFAVVMGYYIGLAKFNKKWKVPYILLGYLLAGSFHGAYDYFLMENQVPGIWIGAIVSLIAGVILAFRAIRLHRKRSEVIHHLHDLPNE